MKTIYVVNDEGNVALIEEQDAEEWAMRGYHPPQDPEPAVDPEPKGKKS